MSPGCLPRQTSGTHSFIHSQQRTSSLVFLLHLRHTSRTGLHGETLLRPKELQNPLIQLKYLDLDDLLFQWSQ